MRSCISIVVASLALSLVACGGIAVDGSDGSNPTGGPAAPAPPTTDPARPTPSTPVLPLPGDTVVIDPSAAPKSRVAPLNAIQLGRCERALGDGIVIPAEEQGAYETTLAGHRRLAGGSLVGGHHFNTLLGTLGDHLFIESWGGSINDDDTISHGVVSVHTTTGEISEVAPLQKGRSFRGRVVPFAGALYGIARDRLVRFSTSSFEEVGASLTNEARLLLNDVGLFVVEGPSLSRVTAGGLVTLPSLGLSPRAETPLDVHSNGDSFYADGDRLYLSGRTTPLVKAPGTITSVRIDVVTGRVFFGVTRAGEPVSSLYALDSTGATHVVEKRSSASGGMSAPEDPIHVLDAKDGKVTFSSRCSSNPYELATTPTRVDAGAGALTYLVDDASYPYVAEVGWMHDRAPGLASYDVFWRETAGAVSFFVRR